jgi:hypothetical protein
MSIRDKGAVEMGTNAAVPRELRGPIELSYHADNKRPNHCGRPRVEAIRALNARDLCAPTPTVEVISREDTDTQWRCIIKIKGIRQHLRLTAAKAMGEVQLVIEPV